MEKSCLPRAMSRCLQFSQSWDWKQKMIHNEEDLVFATSDNKASAAVKASVLVNGDSFTENSVDITPKDLNFGELEQGYSNAPEAQTVTVTNTGNTKITLQQPTGKNYTVGALSQTELEAGKSATFTVQPKKGLSKEEYLGRHCNFQQCRCICLYYCVFQCSKKY